MTISTGERCLLVRIEEGHNTVCALLAHSGMGTKPVLTTLAALALSGHIAEVGEGVWAITLQGRWAVAASDAPESTPAGLRGVALIGAALGAWVAYLIWAGNEPLAVAVALVSVVVLGALLALVLGSDIGERVRLARAR